MKRHALYGLALAALAWAGPALAQSITLPPSTVYGRLGIVAGPGQAIPFSTLQALIFAPPFLISPPTGTTTQGIVITQTGPASGSVTGPLSYNLINVTHTSGVTGAGLDPGGLLNTSATAFRVNATIGGANLSNSPFAASLFSLRHTVGNSTAGDKMAVAASTYSNVTDMVGALFAVEANILLDAPGAAAQVIGVSSDIGIAAGATATDRFAIGIVNHGPVQGSGHDAAIGMANNSPSAGGGWKHLFDFVGGAFPVMDTGGDFFFADTAFTVAHIFNLPNATVTGNVLSLPGISLTGSAQFNLGSAAISTGVISSVPSTNTISGATNLTIGNAASQASAGTGTIVSLSANEAARTTVRYGLTLGNYAELSAFNSGNNGIIIGTQTNVPIIFGTNNIERFRISGAGVATLTLNAIGTTSTDGIVLQNTTAAAAGAQQYSPRLHLIGQGWKTNATAASQTVDWAIENEPSQGAAAPVSTLAFLSQINAGGYTAQASLSSGGVLNLATGIQIASLAPSGNALIGNGTNFVSTSLNATVAPMFQNYLSGLGMTWASATTFTVAAGVATDSTNVFVMTLGSAITKSTSAWAVGSGNGGLDTGAIAANTWYHVFLIRRSDTGVVDDCFTVTVTGCTTGGNISVAYDQKRRFGSVLTNGSSQFVKWIQDGDNFVLDVPVADVNAVTNPGTAAVTRTLTVPTGIRVRANLSVMVEATSSAGAPGGIFISDLSQTDTAASGSVWSLYSFVTYSASITDAILGANVQVMTNTSGQVRSRLQASTANTILTIITNGWTDFRGRNG